VSGARDLHALQSTPPAAFDLRRVDVPLERMTLPQAAKPPSRTP